MRKSLKAPIVKLMLELIFICALGTQMSLAVAAAPDNASASALRARYAALRVELSDNQFQRPLYLNSLESSGHLEGDIYALVNYPFAVVNAALNQPEHWCDVLILHLNIKYCHAEISTTDTVLKVNMGSKRNQALENSYRVEFVYHVAMATPEYLQIQLNAANGPLSSSNYRIFFEVVSVGAGQAFLHLTYSYDYGFAGRLAMNTYLATSGSGKAGFTIVGQKSGGQPEYVSGVRAVVERNTMRYYLAIDAYLSAIAAPPAEQLQQRMQHWFTATEQYPQLYEIERNAYLGMKRDEYLRQQVQR